MNDILEFIDDLKELQVLYQTNELRGVDIQTKISKYERQFNTFESQMDQQDLFFKEYNPSNEV
jgi:hypothetical protein